MENSNSKLKTALGILIQELNLQTEDDAVFCTKVAEKMQKEFSGYTENVASVFKNKMPNTGLKAPIEFLNIKFYTHCKHHMTPILGTVNIAYTPSKWIIGLSKITECVTIAAKKLQLQEDMTVEIAENISKYLEPKHVCVEITAVHYCMQKSCNDELPKIRTTHTIG